MLNNESSLIIKAISVIGFNGLLTVYKQQCICITIIHIKRKNEL